MRGAVCHGQGHGGAALAQQAVCHDKAQGAGQHIRPARVYDNGIFAGGARGGARFEHGAGGHGVGANGNDLLPAARSPQLFDQGAAKAAALAVDHNDAHMQKLLLCLIGPAQAGRHGLQQRRKQAQHHLEQALEQRGAARVV